MPADPFWLIVHNGFDSSFALAAGGYGDLLLWKVLQCGDSPLA